MSLVSDDETDAALGVYWCSDVDLFLQSNQSASTLKRTSTSASLPSPTRTAQLSAQSSTSSIAASTSEGRQAKRRRSRTSTPANASHTSLSPGSSLKQTALQCLGDFSKRLAERSTESGRSPLAPKPGGANALHSSRLLRRENSRGKDDTRRLVLKRSSSASCAFSHNSRTGRKDDDFDNVLSEEFRAVLNGVSSASRDDRRRERKNGDTEGGSALHHKSGEGRLVSLSTCEI
jgi:hypothetical protein